MLLILAYSSCSEPTVSYEAWSGFSLQKVANSQFENYALVSKTKTTLIAGEPSPVYEYFDGVVCTQRGDNFGVTYTSDMDKITITCKPEVRVMFEPAFDTSVVPGGIVRVTDNVLTVDMQALATLYGYTAFSMQIGTIRFVSKTATPKNYLLVS